MILILKRLRTSSAATNYVSRLRLVAIESAFDKVCVIRNISKGIGKISMRNVPSISTYPSYHEQGS